MVVDHAQGVLLAETSIPKMEMSRCYHIAPEYRRSAIYLIVGLFVLVPVQAAVSFFIVQRHGANIAVGSVATIIIGLAMGMLPLRWMLYVDARGIARRRLFWWDYWFWTDLVSGQIEKRYPWTLVDPRRPWWRRELSFSYLSREDRQSVYARINEYYRLPAPPAIPGAVQIRYGNFFRRRATLDAKGIFLLTRDRTKTFLWDEVRRIHVTRMDRIRRDYVVLEIFVADEVIELKLHQGNPMWRGAAAEEINEFLFAHLPAERIQEDVCGERPVTREDTQRTLEAAQKQFCEFRIIASICTAGFVAVSVWMALTEMILLAMFTILMFAILFGSFIWYSARDFRKRIIQLEKYLVAFQGKDESTRQARL